MLATEPTQQKDRAQYTMRLFCAVEMVERECMMVPATIAEGTTSVDSRLGMERRSHADMARSTRGRDHVDRVHNANVFLRCEQIGLYPLTLLHRTSACDLYLAPRLMAPRLLLAIAMYSKTTVKGTRVPSG